MKQLMTKLMVLASLLVLVNACEKIEPTALTDENIAGKAVLCGYVSYNYNYSTTNFANGVEVAIDVDLSSINSESSGNKRYVTTTNSQGYYIIEIPTKPGESVTCKASVCFQADCEKGSDVVKGLFSSSSSASATDGQKQVVNIKCGSAKGYPNSPADNK